MVALLVDLLLPMDQIFLLTPQMQLLILLDGLMMFLMKKAMPAPLIV
jgi:hypothetical protein